MVYQDLEREGWIKSFKASDRQIKNCVALAERDIKTARRLLVADSDWAFSVAYNAVLQAARALMFARGYRPAAREGQHVAAVRFAEQTLGKKFGNDIALFDKMRSKRHRVIYDMAGLVSQHEAKAAFAFATKFVKIVKEYLNR